MLRIPSQPYSVRDALAGKHVLLTGATGFVGKVYLSLLLDRVPEIGRVTLLVRSRGSDHASAHARFERLFESSPAFRPLRERWGAELGSYLGERVHVLKANVHKPACGLDKSTLELLLPTVDLVVHCAGLTDFEGDPGALCRVNTLGANLLADLVAKTSGKRLLHVSTCFVAGSAQGDTPERHQPGTCPSGRSLSVEAELRDLFAACTESDRTIGDPATLEAVKARIAIAGERARALGWPNVYTYSKGLAEEVLARRTDIALTIARPAIIECAMRYPFPGWNEGINTAGPLVWLVSSPFRVLNAKPHHILDLVPVDACARALLLLTARALRDDAPGVYQIATGGTNPCDFERQMDLAGIYLRRRALAGEAGLSGKLGLAYGDPALGRLLTDGPLKVSNLRGLVRGLAEMAKGSDLPALLGPRWSPVLEPALGRGLGQLQTWLRGADKGLSMVERLHQLYKPFIHDLEHRFLTDRMDALSADLVEDEQADFGFDVADLDWRAWWLECQGPGLFKWSIPLLRGEQAPVDPPGDRPLSIPIPPLGLAATQALASNG
jgi:long-chain acyl-CoA synthetase